MSSMSPARRVIGATMLSVACSATQPAEQIPAHALARGPDGWATTTIVSEHHLPAQIEARRLRVAIDGTVVFDHRLPDFPAMIGLVELEPGEHRLQVMLVAHFPLAMIGDACRVTLRASEGFSADGLEPGRIALDAYLNKHGNHQRLAIGVRLTGVSPAMTGHLPIAVETPDDAVHAILPMVEASRAARDIIGAVCHNDKLVQAKVFARMYDERRVAIADATDDAEREHHRAVAAVIEERARRVVKEAQQCVSHHPMFGAYDSVALDEAGCTGDVPPLPAR